MSRPSGQATERHHVTEHKQGGLGQLAATAISGNDITSSCLYVSALAVLHAGMLAPVVLLLVAGVLFLFRSIYAEVVGALPLNGGAYNALLNTTSKFRASIAACLTILSYMATAVISASEAMHYAATLWTALPIMPATVLLLAGFMGLTILGIGDSARVAIGIFVLHIATLTLLALVGAVYLMWNGLGVFDANLAMPLPGGFATALFFGVSAALLGISGFESSANFVEEQAEGVFPKTLRNMWIAVTIFNPGMAMLALALVPIGEVGAHQEALLSHLGDLAGGPWLSTLISVDAALVLSGAVLTSFVGVNGLVRRMALDRCLPQFLLRTNRRGVTHRILAAFCVLAVSILFANLNRVMTYVAKNEHTGRIKFVTVTDDPANVPERLEKDLQFLDEAFPEIDIEFVVLTGTFGPELITELSRKWKIPKNFMFIGSPAGHLMFGLAELGGVRVII